MGEKVIPLKRRCDACGEDYRGQHDCEAEVTIYGLREGTPDAIYNALTRAMDENLDEFRLALDVACDPADAEERPWDEWMDDAVGYAVDSLRLARVLLAMYGGEL